MFRRSIFTMIKSPFYSKDLFLAAAKGKTDEIDKLLDAGAYADAFDNSDQSPLFWAIEGTHMAAIKTLLAKGASVNAANRHGVTPLLRAIQKDEEITKLLVKSGAQVTTGGWTPLHQAARYGNVAVVKLLVDEGANVNARAEGTLRSETPLHVAAMWGHAKAVKKLIQLKADVHAATALGNTPLHYAVGNPPITYATVNDKVAILNLLSDAGANLTACNTKGETPLHIAKIYHYEEAITFLTNKGDEANAVEKVQ